MGLDISPAEKDLIYVRTDVSGACRRDSATSTWKQVVTAARPPAEYARYESFRGVDSLVSAPNDPNIACMACCGQIFRSTNRGDTWIPTSFAAHNVVMEPNGHGRHNPDDYRARRAFPYFMSAWALDWCASDPKLHAFNFGLGKNEPITPP